VAGFAVEQGQHGLVAPVDTVKVANGERTAGQVGWQCVEAAKNFHGVWRSGIAQAITGLS
jgi:hypothetical protein